VKLGFHVCFFLKNKQL